jgi:hypothetical protein
MKPTEDFSLPRRTLLETWDPLRISLPTKDTKHLQQLWREIRDVESVGAWKSLSSLSGQLVEALLKERLRLDRKYDIAALSGKTLGTIISMAQSVGLLPDYDDPPTGTSAITAARTLRNWASHSSLWYDYPTERRASQSLILAICVVESLFPRAMPAFQPAGAQDDDWWIANLERVAPGTILSRLNTSPDSLLADRIRQSPTPFYRHIVGYGTSGSVVKLLELSYDLRFDQVLLRQALTEGFVDIVRNASRSPFRAFTDLLWRLRQLDLESHATLFSILLPFDIDLLVKLLATRSEAWVARYVNEAFRAEPQVFAATAMNPKRTLELTAAFWGAFKEGSGNILNMANILGTLPYEIRASLLQQPAAAVLPPWVARSEPRNAVNLLRSLNDRIVTLNPTLGDLRDAIVKQLVTQVRVTRPSGLHELPLRFERFNMVSDTSAIAVLREVLGVALRHPHLESEWPYVRRLVWDCYALFDGLHAEAFDTALELFRSAEAPHWVMYCLSGLLDLEACAGVSYDHVVLGQDAFLASVADSKVDRWQRFLASVGYWRVCRAKGVSFPDVAKATLKPLRDETRPASHGPSQRLLARIDELLRAR